MFDFLKKKQPQKEEIHRVPYEEVETIITFLDRLEHGEECRRVRLKLWRKIQSLFPDLDFKNETWSLNANNPLNVYIYKSKSSL